MGRITIAIDGHSSTGKSTVARQLAHKLGYIYVDSGAMYRAVTYFALQNGLVDHDGLNEAGLVARLDEISLNFGMTDEAGKSPIILNGENVESAIRTLEVSEWVSPVATLSEVRKKMVQQQHQLGGEGGIVMDGRDIGTVVFPQADLKIFMTASAQVRAQRRYDELLARGDQISYSEVLENVTERDRIDSTREVSPLKQADDAVLIDNSEMTLEDQFQLVLKLALQKIDQID
ncbi:(d)CMP kinase [Aureitalea marina]|uniref:Cytidylate kinase n=1 Tax=Aureitalea marina TaxID=930804 RepID=A0A2S7KNU6_9FLAO|nr:(d)CMP kinase [Aureitalea marina]PQB04299.1 cytidylate kinase [Aureitalea marina]